MDGATRFVLSFDASPVKIGYDAAPLFEAARRAAGFVPKILATDGLSSFAVAFRKTFWTSTGPQSTHLY